MLWIVGPVARDYREYFKRRNISYGHFTDKEVAHGKVSYKLNFSSKANIIKSLDSLPDRIKVTGIMLTGLEQFVLPAAIIGDYFQVPAIPIMAATAATDKILMRQQFMEYNPAISPPFREVSGWNDIDRFFEEYGGPVMLKPANLMKSLFVSKNYSLEELSIRYDQMLKKLPAVYKKNFLKEPRVIIEKYMSGSMHTVAGFVGPDGKAQLIRHAADCITAQDIGIDDNYVYERLLPTSLPAEKELVLFDTVEMGVKALGLKNTPIHAELIFTEEGPKIIEIGARTGGFRPRMYEQAFGIDMYEAAIQCALGKPIELTEKFNRSSAVIEIFPGLSGRYRSLMNQDEIEKLRTLDTLKLKAKPGNEIGKASDGFRAPVVINLAGTVEQVDKDKRYVRQHARIRTEET